MNLFQHLNIGVLAARDQDVLENSEVIDDNDRRRLELYHKSFDDQRVDISLIMALISNICKKDTSLQG